MVQPEFDPQWEALFTEIHTKMRTRRRWARDG